MVLSDDDDENRKKAMVRIRGDSVMQSDLISTKHLTLLRLFALL